MSYENLDRIADLYIPILALLSVISVLIPPKNIYSIKYKAMRLIGVVSIAYLLMYLDLYFDIYPYFGLDYSTHTALSLALTCFLALVYKNLKIYLYGFFVAYLFLMLYQRYHTVMDILATIIEAGGFLFIILRNQKKSIGRVYR